MSVCQELGELYSKYQKQGLVILGFPCNQFNGQEPGNNNEIKQFAKSKGADFPMMSKIEVNGAGGMWDALSLQKYHPDICAAHLSLIC